MRMFHNCICSQTIPHCVSLHCFMSMDTENERERERERIAVFCVFYFVVRAMNTTLAQSYVQSDTEWTRKQQHKQTYLLLNLSPMQDFYYLTTKTVKLFAVKCSTIKWEIFGFCLFIVSFIFWLQLTHFSLSLSLWHSIFNSWLFYRRYDIKSIKWQNA